MHRGGPGRGRPLEPLVPRPSGAGTFVVAAWWVNAMKSAMSEEEFRKVVIEYGRYLREGGEFDREVVGFGYWRRARGIENGPRGRDWR